MSQINFMQSFVDDLLDFRMICEGAFKLTMNSFCPNSVIDFVLSIFLP